LPPLEQNAQLDSVVRLLQAGASATARDIVGRTPLHWAVRGRSLDCVRVLLRAGAPVNARDHLGACAERW
jgi:ankyrin repeat protein